MRHARRAGATALGPADVVTLARASLVGGVTALVVDRLGSGAIPVATLVLLSSVALALDGVDGWVARRTRTVSALGARFDMEVDAFLVLVLSVHVAATVAPWALVIGAMRYAFVVASWLLPWLSGGAPDPVLREGRGRGAGDRAGGGVGAVCSPSRSRRRWSSRRWPRCSGRSAKSVTWLWRARLIRCGADTPPLIRRGAADPHGVRVGRVVAGSVTARGGRVVAGSVTAR